MTMSRAQQTRSEAAYGVGNSTGSYTRMTARLVAAQAELTRLASSSETEVSAVTYAFRSLAGEAGQILRQSAGIVASVGNENMSTALSTVQALSDTVQTFLGQRVDAATSILETLQAAEILLSRLAWATQCQEGIAGHLKALSVLTNVEVAQMGEAGSGFQFLARELYTFARSVSEQTQELARQSQGRRQALEETRRELAASLPGLHAELLRSESDLSETLRVIGEGLSQLASIPERFQIRAETTTRQIAGVVSAIQAHDITRQQAGHVQSGLQDIASTLAGADSLPSGELSIAYAGLTIQVSQLRNIQDTVGRWVSQVGVCMGGIQELSASDVVEVGAIVLAQERELSSQLARVEELQRRSLAYGVRIQHTVQGLFSLVELVNEHLKRSQAIRQRLQLLTFNSLIEAHHLGRQGGVVSAIANLIKSVSAEWIVIADQSHAATAQIVELVQRTNQVMEVFSDASSEKLREDQTQSSAALDTVRKVAVFVAREAAQMQGVTEKMQRQIQQSGNTVERLQASFAHLGVALEHIEGLAAGLQQSYPQVEESKDLVEVERLFSRFYTTEIERQILQSVLRGTPVAVLESSLAGNAVEFF